MQNESQYGGQERRGQQRGDQNWRLEESSAHGATSEEQEHSEGNVARAIEQQTAKLPSDTFLWGAFGAMGVSFILQIGGARTVSNFVGLWVPTILLFGLYNKIVKVAGSDRTDQPA